MIDDKSVARVLTRAGERQRATAPDAAETQRALLQLNTRIAADPVERGAPRHRGWSIAMVLTAAAAVVLAVIVVGNSGTDTIRNVPVTQPEIAPSRDSSIAVDVSTLPDSAAVPANSAAPDQPVELDFPVASTDLVLGSPIVRQFEGLPLTDITMSPEADRIAVSKGSEVCIVSTQPAAPPDTDRCYPFPDGQIARGSITWAPDGSTLVFHHDVFGTGQDSSDLVELDLDSGELTVLSDDGQLTDGDINIAPTFTSDGTLYFFRIDRSDGLRSELYKYNGDGTVTSTGLFVNGVPGIAGQRADGNSIVTIVSGLGAPLRMVSVSVNGEPTRSIAHEVSDAAISDAAQGRVLLVARTSTSPGGFQLAVADFTSGGIAAINIPQLEESSMRIVGGGLAPDATQVAVIVADQENPDGHLLLVADIAANGSVGPLNVLATGPEFAPNDGDRTIKPAGLGLFAEIVWTDSSLIYTLGPNEIVTLPLL